MDERIRIIETGNKTMTVGELIEQLNTCDPTHDVLVELSADAHTDAIAYETAYGEPGYHNVRVDASVRSCAVVLTNDGMVNG